MNNGTVFEAIVLEYDRYEPPLGARSCHKYLDLEAYRFKNVFNILIVQIPGLGRTLHLTKDMNDQMVEFES